MSKAILIKFITYFKYPECFFGDLATKYLPVAPDASPTILDAPCGWGGIVHLLSKKLPDGKFYGSDLSEKYIERARKIFPRKNLEYHAGDIFQFLEQRPEFCDLLLVINSLFLLPHHDKLLSLFARTLKENGRLILLVPLKESKNFSFYNSLNPSTNLVSYNQTELKGLLENHSFKVLSEKVVNCYQFHSSSQLKGLRFIRSLLYGIAYRLFPGLPRKIPSYLIVEAVKQS